MDKRIKLMLLLLLLLLSFTGCNNYGSNSITEKEEAINNENKNDITEKKRDNK